MNVTKEFCSELLNINKTNEHQKLVINELMLKAAKYKAYYYGKSDLAEKLENQIIENLHSCIGEFDGFSYASWRANAVYRTLDKMVDDGLITLEEHKFCISI